MFSFNWTFTSWISLRGIHPGGRISSSTMFHVALDFFIQLWRYVFIQLDFYVLDLFAWHSSTIAAKSVNRFVRVCCTCISLSIRFAVSWTSFLFHVFSVLVFGLYVSQFGSGKVVWKGQLKYTPSNFSMNLKNWFHDLVLAYDNGRVIQFAYIIRKLRLPSQREQRQLLTAVQFDDDGRVRTILARQRS